MRNPGLQRLLSATTRGATVSFPILNIVAVLNPSGYSKSWTKPVRTWLVSATSVTPKAGTSWKLNSSRLRKPKAADLSDVSSELGPTFHLKWPHSVIFLEHFGV